MAKAKSTTTDEMLKRLWALGIPAIKTKTVEVPVYTCERPALGLGVCRANVLNVPEGVRAIDAITAAYSIMIAVRSLAEDVAMDGSQGHDISDKSFAIPYLTEVVCALLEAVTDGHKQQVPTAEVDHG